MPQLFISFTKHVLLQKKIKSKRNEAVEQKNQSILTENNILSLLENVNLDLETEVANLES